MNSAKNRNFNCTYYLLDVNNYLEPIKILDAKQIEEEFHISRNKINSYVRSQRLIDGKYVLIEENFYNMEEQIETLKFEENVNRIWYITREGTVFSIKKKTGEKQILKPVENDRGEMVVNANGKIFTLKNLIAKCFIRDWSKGCIVKVKNGNQKDVRVENITIISRSDFYRELQNKRMKKKVGLYENNKLVRKWNSIQECAANLYIDKSGLAKALKHNLPYKYDIRYIDE